jgi:hypothetical protein
LLEKLQEIRKPSTIFALVRPLIDDPNSAEFDRISESTKPLSPNRNHFSKKRTTIETQNRFSESRKQPSIRDEGN